MRTGTRAPCSGATWTRPTAAEAAVAYAQRGATVAPHEPAARAEELALATPARRVPVVDDEGRLVGIVALTTDLQAVLRHMKLSARNQLTGTVKSVNEGAAIANVELDVNGQRLVASDVILATG